VVDVLYPENKVDFNQSFNITLVFELLNGTRKNVSVHCPSVEEYKNSTLNNLQRYTGVKINNFASEEVKLPVKFVDDTLYINRKKVEQRINKNIDKKDSRFYMMTMYGSRIFLALVTINAILLNSFNKISIIGLIISVTLMFLYLSESDYLYDSELKLVDAIKR